MNKKSWLVYIPQRSIILFIILNILAMFSYPGGTLHDPSTFGYSFTNNFISDLGRFISFNGSQNFYSNLFFNSSMMITGFILSLFFIHIRTIFNIENSMLYWLSMIGTIAGIAGGYSMIGVGLTPADLYLDQHVIFAHWLFRFFLISAICYTIIIFKTDLIDNKYAIGYCIFAMLILSYIIISELGPSPKENMSTLMLQVVSQKAILFSFLITIYMQTKGLQSIIDE
mgnify:CR=1 FL=1